MTPSIDRLFIQACFVAVAWFAFGISVFGEAFESSRFRIHYNQAGVNGLADPNDPFGAEVVPGPKAKNPVALSAEVLYQRGDGQWQSIKTRDGEMQVETSAKRVSYHSPGKLPLVMSESYWITDESLEWTVKLTAREAVRIGDFSITLPVTLPRGEDPKQIFEHGYISQPFVSGDSSFIYFTRASGAPAHLLLSTMPGTSLEFIEKNGGQPRVFVHSARTVGLSSMGTWRHPVTALDLKTGEMREYGFRFKFAKCHDEIRDLLHNDGLFDIRVVPGMTLPTNLKAKFSLHTKAEIEKIVPEFPAETTLAYLGETLPDHHVYEVAFRKLGENLLTIHHGEGRRTRLEFFSCEPMETLIKKRARFLVDRQMIRDPSKWWDGAFGPYDMAAKVTRTIDDPDIFRNRMVYTLTCDDPGLCKAPYIAAKNAHWPDQKEIEALEYHLDRFVWGKLQRTDQEIPYPYGVYGTPHWFDARDEAGRRKRAEISTDLKVKEDVHKMHVWRSYDYPHIIMLYYHMYEIAKDHPQMSKYLDAAGYLERAWGTAKAFFIYPYEIYPSYYETYKWGLYNELVVLDLIDALRREGFADRADWLTKEWEKKVKYFVYDDEYPLRSEYAFDRTAFESSHALAKYGATRDMSPDKHLWWDWKKKKWYSHPVVRREDSRAFMDRQIAGNLAVRGWLNPAYYRLGSDPGVSYMAAMGGWGILDYGLNFTEDPYGWLQLGYASYLSSWCLMNTGDENSGYGAWFPGWENDGASGWQFETGKSGKAWMASEAPEKSIVPRGPWNYDGEIDLGYGSALRMAQTLVTDDPVFGWIGYGGELIENDEMLRIIPRDGLAKRFNMIRRDPRSPSGVLRFKLQLARDGFAREVPIHAAKDMSRFSFMIEERGAGGMSSDLMLGLPYGLSFTVTFNGHDIPLVPSGDWDFPWRLSLPAGKGRLDILKVDR